MIMSSWMAKVCRSDSQGLDIAKVDLVREHVSLSVSPAAQRASPNIRRR
jgi:hypothetical protein